MRTLLLASLLSAMVAGAPAANAEYPDRPITLLLPFSAGGGGDTLGRYLAEKFSSALGQPVVVENKPGAGGMIGTRMVAQAKPDGYTVTIGGMTTHILAPIVHKEALYDPIKDFVSLGAFGNSSILMLAAKDFPASNLKELKALSDKSSNPIQYASWGLGSTGNFCGEVLVHKANIKMQHVPYKGTAQIVTDILGGHVPIGFVDMVTGTPFVKNGKMKGLAVCTRRSPSLPDIASYKEQGVDFDRKMNWAMYAPAGTPQPIVDKWSDLLKKTVARPEVIQKFLTLGITADYIPGPEHEKQNASDASAWRQIAEQSDLIRE